MFSLLALYLSYRRDRAAVAAAPKGDVVALAPTPRTAHTELPLAA
jgi:hypothetical protein